MITKQSLPLSVLDNEYFRNFLLQYTDFNVPYSTNIREKGIIQQQSNSILHDISNELRGKNITIQADTSNDARRYNSVVSAL